MEASVRALAAALLVAAAPAFAQSGPSFDCAKASIALERVICGSAGLSTADREMAAAYSALVDRLSGAAREHLIKDQARWVDDWQACDTDGPLTEQCLAGRYQDRLASLQAFGEGSYPFISEHALAKFVKFKDGSVYNFDARYPRFDGAGVDFITVNRSFADAARDAVDDMLLPPSVTRELDFTLYRLNPDVVSIQVRTATYDMTVHIYLEGTLVDLRTSKALRPEDVFAPGEEQHRKFVELVQAAVTEDFKDMGSGEVPADLEMLKGLEPADYLFDKDGLTLSLPVVANHLGAKFYGATIPYAALKPLLRADGPLGRLEK